MRLALAVTLLLCGSAAVQADAFPVAPDEGLFRTDERFEVTCRGVTGSQIDVLGEVRPGRRCYFKCVTPAGGNVLLDILLQGTGRGSGS